MLWLLFSFLAGCSGALFSLTYKLRERGGLPVGPLMMLFSLFSVLGSGFGLLLFGEPLYNPAAIWLGVLFGFFMFTAVRLFFVVSAKTRLNLTWLIIQFGLLIPFFLSIFFYGETLKPWSLIGVGLIFLSILFFGFGKRKGSVGVVVPDRRIGVMLILSSLCSGLALSIPRIYAAAAPQGGTFTLLLFQSLTLTVLTLLLPVAWRSPLKSSLSWRRLIPLSAYMSSTYLLSAVFILLALKEMGGSIVYPFRTVINILSVFGLSFLLFREKVGAFEAVGVIVALGGIVLVAATNG